MWSNFPYTCIRLFTCDSVTYMQYAMLANAPSGIVYVMNCAGYETEYHPYKFSSKMTAVSGMKTLFVMVYLKLHGQMSGKLKQRILD